MIDIALSQIDLGDGIPVGFCHFDAMGFHPGPNDVLLALADVAELRQVVPQLDDKALADAVRQHPPRRRWKEIVVLNRTEDF